LWLPSPIVLVRFVARLSLASGPTPPTLGNGRSGSCLVLIQEVVGWRFGIIELVGDIP
jgi:hypothetical protein